LNRFTHLNTLFDTLNDLNLSYNQSINYKDFTFLQCQDYYIQWLITKPELADPNVNLNISQDTANKSTIEKYDLQVTESLKRINDIITKLL
jgi:hypothetical protein